MRAPAYLSGRANNALMLFQPFPVLALLRHANRLGECSVIGAERKWLAYGQTDANDPVRDIR